MANEDFTIPNSTIDTEFVDSVNESALSSDGYDNVENVVSTKQLTTSITPSQTRTVTNIPSATASEETTTLTLESPCDYNDSVDDNIDTKLPSDSSQDSGPTPGLNSPLYQNAPVTLYTTLLLILAFSLSHKLTNV